MVIKKLTSKEVYSNPWISVNHEDVEFPNGDKGIYGVVHFKEQVATGIIERDDKILFIETYRYPTKKLSLELPAGGIDQGERAIDAAYREVLEETGIRSKKLTHSLDFFSSNGVTDQQFHIFRGEYDSGTEIPQINEISRIFWLSKDEIKAKIKTNEITDGPTLTAIMHHLLFS